MWGKRIIFLCAMLISICGAPLLNGGENSAFTIVAGRLASIEGMVVMAHNENPGGKNYFVNIHKVPASTHRTVITRPHANGEPSGPLLTLPMLWLQTPGAASGDSFFNEKGVAICSNTCLSREEKGKTGDNSINYLLPRIMAENAHSARSAVMMAGQLIDNYGYNDSGCSFAIADKTEAWILQVVRGKHWVAQRVPDRHAAVVANCYTIGAVNLKDSANFLGSADLVEYAIRRGWHSPARDGAFHFAKIYSPRGYLENDANQLRQWRALSLLSKREYDDILPLPFSFQPEGKLELLPLFRLLRDHYEETPYDLTNTYKTGSPNQAKMCAICDENTRYAFVAELRSQIAEPLSSRIWIAFRRPDANAFSPWYCSMTSAPHGYGRGSLRPYSPNPLFPPDDYAKPDKKFAYWVFAELAELTDRDYKSFIRNVRKEWKTYEDYMVKRLKKMETEFEYQLKINPEVGLRILTTYIHNLEYRRWIMAEELIRQISKSLKN